MSAASAAPGVVVGAAVPDMLERCRELVRPALSSALASLDPWTGEVAAFSLGWRDVTGARAVGAAEGKGVRQALAVLGAEAVGADGTVAVAGAVAVELIHAFSLLHDDVMDGDVLRRGRETVWKAYGTGPAVLTGDALFALALRTLADAPTVHAAAAVRRLCATLSELVRGQAEDLHFESRPWTGADAVRPREYRAMAERKTGSLLGCSAAIGGLLGGAPAAAVEALDAAGRHLGVAFQTVDDLLGIWGDPAVTGKPLHSDLRNRKKTHPVLTALAADNSAARELAGLLNSSTRLDDAELARAALLIDEAGGAAAARDEARRSLDSARACLSGVPLVPRAARDLDALLTFLLHRVV
ncbi:polyprenyl synthetase family protein [Streptomyces sp. Da 82-17]|uniref:polyprenyl synthetase family protein n=1 Tax=Streptomyces sp. Da 82-17 TaxID=3377116 RepID=UPI0038D39907